jgi:hypothetical protein
MKINLKSRINAKARTYSYCSEKLKANWQVVSFEIESLLDLCAGEVERLVWKTRLCGVCACGRDEGIQYGLLDRTGLWFKW